MAWGAIYYVLPRVSGKQWYSRRLATAHYWLTLTGVIIMISALTVAGLYQAAAWEEGTVVYRAGTYVLSPFMAARAFSGLLIVVGQILLFFNMYKTLFGHEGTLDESTEPDVLPTGDKL